jgi:hypothetical protein
MEELSAGEADVVWAFLSDFFSGCTIDAPYAEDSLSTQTPSNPTLSSEAKMGVFNLPSVPSQLIFLALRIFCNQRYTSCYDGEG